MMPPELAALTRPLEAFEAIRRRAARLGGRLCDLSYANPYGGAAPGVRRVLRDALDDERSLDLQYSPFGGQTLARRAVADALSASHAGGFHFRDVVLTPGAMAALHIALRVAGAPGDDVLIPVPCWLDYPAYARCLGLEPRLVELPAPDFGLDADRIEAALGPRTAALVLSQPANPTGRCYSADQLAGVAAVLARAAERTGRRITWVSDETHRDFVQPGRFRSPVDVWPDSIVVHSFGKYHALQGQRIGYAAVGPRHPARRKAADDLARWARIAGFCTPTALMQRALPELLHLQHDTAALHAGRERLAEALRNAGYGVAPADGTYFLYAATPAAHDDWAFTRALAARGVLVLPAPVFHHAGHFRISLTASAPMLERALGVLRELAP